MITLRRMRKILYEWPAAPRVNNNPVDYERCKES
jgi:hypothetical protein